MWRRLGVLVGCAVFGCGGPDAGAEAPAQTPAASSYAIATASTSAAPTGWSSASAEPVAQPPPAASTPAAALALRWSDFPGPVVAPPGDTPLWVATVGMMSESWDKGLDLYFVKPKRTEANELVLAGDKREIFVPGALAVPPSTTAPKKGDVVLVGHTIGLNLRASYGVVADVVPVDGGETRYLVKYSWVDEMETEVPARQLRVMTGALAFGERVAFRVRKDEWSVGTFVTKADKGAWILSVGRLVKQEDVKAIPLKPRKKGEKVWVASSTTSSYSMTSKTSSYWTSLSSGTVAEVLGGGALYKIKFAKGEDGTPDGNEDVTYDVAEVFTPFGK